MQKSYKLQGLYAKTILQSTGGDALVLDIITQDHSPPASADFDDVKVAVDAPFLCPHPRYIHCWLYHCSLGLSDTLV